MKLLNLNEANERIRELTDRLHKVRETRNNYSAENHRLSAWVRYAKRMAAEQEKALWGELREKHPNVVGRAANMAAHNWHIALFDGRVLMLSVKGGSYEMKATKDVRYNGPLPRMCVTCAHSASVCERGTQAISCLLHSERHLKMDVCDQHEFAERNQGAQ
ncbi:hypothetical protein [Sulfitobacter sp. R18_1]|uniref:hypothetical protein n=1 Tax=Sulfitobacter sp. R18_1 TaxID=2821104 RepID=UPI001ADAB40A|nr:hypothetical protein [Sulfitobacter sp. R18_1]MBO9428210.1 hypothetical protein [Sulfitobacter sp. R18_1]